MVAHILPLAALLTGVAFLVAGHGTLTALIPLRLDLEGATAGTAGLVGAAYFAGLLLGARYASGAIRRVGHIRAFAAYAAVFAGVALLLALVSSEAVWFLVRFAAGFAMAGLVMAIESWLNVSSLPEWRGRVMAAYLTVNFAAIGFGQLMLGVYPVAGADLFLLAGLLVTASIVPIALTRATAPAPHGLEAGVGAQVLSTSPLAVVGALTSGLLLGTFYSLAPLFAARIGFPAESVGLIVSSAIIGALVAQAPIGWISDLMDRRALIVILSVLVAASSVAILFLQHDFFGIVAGFVLFGMTAFAIYPVCLSHGADQLPVGGDMLGLSAALLASYGVGAILGPLIAGFAFQVAGPVAMFMFTAAASIVAAMFGIWRMGRGPVIPPEDRLPFVGMPPQTQPTTVGLDPRSERPDDVFVAPPSPPPGGTPG